MKIRGAWFAMLAVVLVIPTLPGAAQVASKSKGGAVASQKPAAKKQNKQAAPATAGCTVVQAVASQLDPKKLEGSQDVSKAASGFAGQMIYNHPSANAKGRALDADELIGGSERDFISPLLSAALPAPSEGKEDQSAKKCTAASSTADTNKQTGAPSGSDGTTSATELTGIPELLSIAVENGSVTNSISGNTMTLSTTLYGLFKGFGLVQDSSHNYDECYVCVRLGASGTFNVANTSSPLNSATRKAASQWQLKYSVFDQSTRSAAAKDLWEGRSPKDKNKFEAYSPQGAAADLAANGRPDWKSSASNAYSALEKALDDFVKGNLTEIESCIKASETASASTSATQTCTFKSAPTQTQPATKDGLANFILQGLDSDPTFQKALSDMLADPGTKGFVEKYEKSLTTYKNAVTQFEADVANLSKGWNADVTFGEQFPTTTASSTASTTTSGALRAVGRDATTTSSSTHLPDYLVGGVDISWQPKTATKPQADGSGPTNGAAASSAGGTPAPTANKAPSAWTPSWTFNGKGSFYTNPSAGLNEKTFRGVQASTQFQWTLGASPFVNDANDKGKVTVALNGSYQRLPENKDVKGKRPDTTSGSFKLTIPFTNGISIPLAVTYGNSQQQQAKGAYVIGNFGLSFDADKLASLLALKH